MEAEVHKPLTACGRAHIDCQGLQHQAPAK